MNKYYYETLIPFVDALIREKGTFKSNTCDLPLSTLDEDDQEIFAAHLIRHDAFYNEEWEFLYDNNCRKDLAHLLTHYMITASVSTPTELAKEFSKSAVKFYQKRMQELLEERSGYVFSETMQEMGYHSEINKQNGEVEWRANV